MSSVNALAYVGITASDLDAWKTYATEVLGLQVRPDSTDELLKLRMDDRVYRFFVEKGEPGVSTLGFEVNSRGALEELAAKVEASGAAVKEELEPGRRSRRRRALRDVGSRWQHRRALVRPAHRPRRVRIPEGSPVRHG